MDGVHCEISRIDEKILKMIYREALETGSHKISLKDIFEETKFLDEKSLFKSVYLLRDRGYCDVQYDSRNECALVKIDSVYFEEYARNYREDYYDLYIAIPEKIVNDNLLKSEDIASSLKMPATVINLILDYFIQKNFIKADIIDNNIHIYNICPPFKRLFKRK